MGFLDFLFGKRKQEQPKAQPKAVSKTPVQSVREPITPKSVNPQEKSMSSKPSIPTMEPFVFKSDCHQRYENGNEVMGLQQCVRTVSVEKNTNGCRGYKLNPGDGYIVKVFNDDLGKPNMSDKPMRIVSRTADKVELRGFPIEAQPPFGWQEVDYRDYGFTVYYTNGKVSKCVLHMFDRNVDLEYRKSDASAPLKITVNSNTDSQSSQPSVKAIAMGAPFRFSFDVTVIKQYYNQRSEQIKLEDKVIATMIRTANNGNIMINLSNLSILKSKGVIQTNLSLVPDFSYNQDAEGDEFASAEINNSWAAMSSGKEYVSLFQITKQKGNMVSFIINNLPGDQDFYYLIMFRQ